MRSKDTIASLREEKKQLKNELKLYKELLNDKTDRLNKLKHKHSMLFNWVNAKFEFFIDISSKNQTPNLPWLIKNTHQVLMGTRDY